MRDRSWHVRCIMTKGATEFITPLSVSALSEEKVYGDLFSLTDEAEMGHIRLARDADAVVIAPASANIMARIAHGHADDLATTAVLATAAPVLIAPAMNPFMWANPATQANAATLRQRGYAFIGPDSGDMACGEEGPGRLAEIPAIIDARRTACYPDRACFPAGQRLLHPGQHMSRLMVCAILPIVLPANRGMPLPPLLRVKVRRSRWFPGLLICRRHRASAACRSQQLRKCSLPASPPCLATLPFVLPLSLTGQLLIPARPRSRKPTAHHRNSILLKTPIFWRQSLSIRPGPGWWWALPLKLIRWLITPPPNVPARAVTGLLPIMLAVKTRFSAVMKMKCIWSQLRVRNYGRVCQNRMLPMR